MAAISASRSWARRAITTGAIAGLGLLALAIPASAHTPSANAGCDKDTNKPVVTVTATSYELNKDQPNNKTPNTVEIFVDGAEKAAVTLHFGANLPAEDTKQPFDKLDGKVDHSFKIVVTAWNDKDFEHAPFWSQIFNKKSGVCDKTPPSSETSTSSSPPSSPAPPTTTTTVAPAVGANASLASTGVSIAIPIAIGALLLVGGGTLLLMMRRRGKA